MEKNDLKDFPLPKGWSLSFGQDKRPVLWTKEGLSLCLDFSTGQSLSPHQPLAKAIGFKGKPLFVLDVTAGWAKDSVLMARLGCHVTAVEAHPFVFHFVQQSLKPEEASSLHLKFVLDNSLNYLNNLKKDCLPDVIFMDPMFGERKKSLSRKPLRVLKSLVDSAKDQKALFALALKKAGKRVVVKRHRREAPMQKNSLCSFPGRSVCYDVFSPEKRKA